MKILPFDWFWFFAGFLVALVVVFIVRFIRLPMISWINSIKQKRATREKQLPSKAPGVENYLRKETINAAQKMHLASNLFSLDEILITPQIITSPPSIEKNEARFTEEITSVHIPYLPDSPELYAEFPLPTITVAETLQNRVNITLIGRPGYGKTVALAHLASQIARQDPATGILVNFIPLLLHVIDLDISLKEDQDPLDNLIRAIQARSSLIQQPQIPGFIRKALGENRLLLLLDGLDEISPANLDETNNYLASLIKNYPDLLIITTGSPDYLDGLLKLCFTPVNIVPWGSAARMKSLEKWLKLWTDNLSAEIKKSQGVEQINLRLLSNWLAAEKGVFSPLEWTMKVWMAITGEGGKTGSEGIVEAFISRLMNNDATRHAFGYLALEMIRNAQISRQYGQMESVLNRFSIPAVYESSSGDATESTSDESTKGERAKEQKVSSAGRALNLLIDNNLIWEHPNGELRFVSPAVLGALSGIAIDAVPPSELMESLSWSVAQESLHYSVIRHQSPQWIVQILQNDEETFHRNLLLASRWLKDVPQNAPWRAVILKRLFTLLLKQELPLGMRFRLLAGISTTNDPGAGYLYKQLLSSPSPYLRMAGAIGLGLMQDAGNLQDLLNSLADQDIAVRVSACLAIGAIPGQAITKVLIDILMSGDENIRLVAAEILAFRPPDGNMILREALSVDDILTRRAAVLGLALIRDDWSRDTMEKIAVEDGQWVVRNAASQALEALSKPNPHIPQKLPPAQEASWLIAFASRQGLGINPDQPPTEMLLAALKTGTPEEQLSALRYLRKEPSSTVILEVYRMLTSEDELISQAAALALWYFIASGAPMPSLTKYGVK